MNLKPLDDRIVVKPNEAEKTTASGLVIPDTAKEKPQMGSVLAVGPGRWSDDKGTHAALTDRQPTSAPGRVESSGLRLPSWLANPYH